MDFRVVRKATTSKTGNRKKKGEGKAEKVGVCHPRLTSRNQTLEKRKEKREEAVKIFQKPRVAREKKKYLQNREEKNDRKPSQGAGWQRECEKKGKFSLENLFKWI